MSQTEEKFNIKDFSQSYKLPNAAIFTLLTEFQTHVQSMMREWRNNKDTLRLSATLSTEAWKSVVNSATLCVRDKIFSDDLTELRVNAKTIDERYTEMLKDNNMYNDQTQQEVDDLVLGKVSILSEVCPDFGENYQTNLDRFEDDFQQWVSQTVRENGQEVQVDASRAIVALDVEPTRQVVQGIFNAFQELDAQRAQKRTQAVSSDEADSVDQTKLDAETLRHVLAFAWDMDKAYGGTHHLTVERPEFEFDDIDPWGTTPSYNDCDAISSDQEGDEVEAIYDVVTIPVSERWTMIVDDS
ncbi:hypothetical protein I203_108512 [Kwoniella mangroviensis CBS 8507]|uniref:hypothetical protein n=1 Tax=Kwoniella mangroviensis CBS 8507 TaxID=1296122 RepID=UPI00080D6D47|nr:uncharacterized protein I203_05408 [Kwoniella mangroviensis CBS 8507]OCF65727.1 hypothetical protein I203_05408 [Kwoniella mangroviensis CBS 8507]